jgi:protein-tyrosine-phosphatase
LRIVTLCTGNVARSVMLGYMLTTLAESSGHDWSIRTAGTHVAEGSAMSARTRDALLAVDGLGTHRYGAHRSHQLSADDVAWADVILASEADHVNFVRANFPDASNKTVALVQFVERAPRDRSFDAQVQAVAALDPSSASDVVDPAGGDQSVYDQCAAQLWNVAQTFVLLVDEGNNA